MKIIIFSKRKQKWKTVKINNVKTNYRISNYGILINIKNGKILKKRYDKDGYIYYRLYFNSKEHYKLAHRLVAEAFIENPLNKPQVNHIDGIKDNNFVKNLEWCTAKENIKHADEHGLRYYRKGIESNFNKYPEEMIIEICELLQNGYTNKQIQIKLGIIGEKYRALIKSIKKRKNWKHISKNYLW